MINYTNFLTLIGAIKAALEHITTDMAPIKATKHPHLDPDPGTVGEARAKLEEVLKALLDAEKNLTGVLAPLKGLPVTPAIKVATTDAWDSFMKVVTEQSFSVLAAAVRRLLWVQGPPQTGAPGWGTMHWRIRFILKTFTMVSLGGGWDEFAGDPGFLSSSAESVSLGIP